MPNTYTCAHVYTCACVHVYLCACVHACMCICIHVYLLSEYWRTRAPVAWYTRAHVPCAHAFWCACVHASMCTCAYVHLYSCIHVAWAPVYVPCAYVYMHACVHTYLWTCVRACKCSCVHVTDEPFVTYACTRVCLATCLHAYTLAYTCDQDTIPPSRARERWKNTASDVHLSTTTGGILRLYFRNVASPRGVIFGRWAKIIYRHILWPEFCL